MKRILSLLTLCSLSAQAVLTTTQATLVQSGAKTCHIYQCREHLQCGNGTGHATPLCVPRQVCKTHVLPRPCTPKDRTQVFPLIKLD